MKIPLLFAFAVTLCGASWAQPTPGVVAVAPATGIPELDHPVDPDRKQTFKLTLKNVKPSLMAYWLEPNSHQVPPEFRKTVPVVPQEPVEQKGAFRLPQGVDHLVAVDPQNALLVFGTAKGVKELVTLIQLLDKPLRQVEIEAQFIRLDSKDLNAVFGDTPPVAIPEKAQVRFVRSQDGFAKALDTLIKNQNAKVLSAPRVLAINNLTADISQTALTPVQLQVGNEGAKGVDLPEGTTLNLETSRSLSVTPTINNDNTITVVAHITEGVQLKSSANAQDVLVLQKTGDGLETIANMRDGETIAVEISPKAGAATPAQRTVVFLTTRIVRRAGGA